MDQEQMFTGYERETNYGLILLKPGLLPILDETKRGIEASETSSSSPMLIEELLETGQPLCQLLRTPAPSDPNKSLSLETAPRNKKSALFVYQTTT